MAGGSIGTSVQRRHSSGQQLDLRPRDGTNLFGKIHHGWSGQVLVCDQIEETARPLQKSASLGPTSSQAMLGSQASPCRASAGRYREGVPP